MDIRIRKEEPRDHHLVEEITREAFWNLYCPGCREHFMAHELRKHPDFIPELTFVIEVDGKVVGSIFYSYSKVVDANCKEHKTISFGPVSIAPHLHRQGLGRKLISHSIEAAKKAGHRAIFIGGFKYHYTPYGFLGAKKYGVSMPDGKYYAGIMALPLFEGTLDNIQGCIHFSEGMYPDNERFEEYDSKFSHKEKEVKACQKEFEKAVSEIDEQIY